MTLIKRRIILFFTVILFIALSVGLVFYAMGYRFNPGYNEIRQVGIIDVAATPSDADIYLDGEQVGNRSPYQIKDLYPGTYRVSVQKDGYQTWEKDILVNAREVSWIRNARTFIANPEQKSLFEGEIVSLLETKNKQAIFFIEKQQIEQAEEQPEEEVETAETKNTFVIQALNSDTGEITQIATLETNEDSLEIKEIASDNKTLLIQSTSEESTTWSTISGDQESTELSFEKEETPANITFFPGSNNEFLYLNNESELIKRGQDDSEIIIDDFVNHFSTSNNTIHYIRDAEDNIPTVRAFNTGFALGEQTPDDVVILPTQKITPANGSAIKVNNFGDVAVNTEDKGLLLFDNDRNRIIKLGSDVKDFSFGPNTRKILFHNGTEVSFYEMSPENEEYLRQAYQANQVNLLTRYSTPITSMGLYVDEAWVWVALENEIKLIELDERGSRNTYTLPAKTSTSVFQQENGEDLFFYNQAEQEIHSYYIFDPVSILGQITF